MIRKKKAEKKHLFCSPSNTRHDNLYCQQAQKHYLLQCQVCFIQYDDKSETAFNLRLNNHRKDSKKKDAILACTHIQNPNHIFQRDVKFFLIEQITKIYNTIEEFRFILKKTREFLDLKTLHNLSR